MISCKSCVSLYFVEATKAGSDRASPHKSTVVDDEARALRWRVAEVKGGGEGGGEGGGTAMTPPHIIS